MSQIQRNSRDQLTIEKIASSIIEKRKKNEFEDLKRLENREKKLKNKNEKENKNENEFFYEKKINLFDEGLSPLNSFLFNDDVNFRDQLNRIIGPQNSVIDNNNKGKKL